ncbi:HIT family protein [Candidatus Woesearchaeota archaeon]|nr:HIT family protein [Candidatus Woesearchaeota archaeon]
MDEQEALEQQKENCIFCKIIKGDIPAKKVYEDDKLIAVMDINPAAKGHVLVIPKEHYPLLPVIPFEEVQHLFRKTKKLVKAMKEALLCQGITIFIANGGAAGQQSPHFLYHLIPREKNDFLPIDPLMDGDATANDEFCTKTSTRIKQFMQAYNTQTGRETPAAAPTAPSEEQATAQADDKQAEAGVSEERLEKLIAMINDNEDLKDALVHRPEEVKEAVKTQEKWRELFQGVDIDQLSDNLKAMTAARYKQGRQEEDKKPSGEADLDKIGEVLK